MKLKSLVAPGILLAALCCTGAAHAQVQPYFECFEPITGVSDAQYAHFGYVSRSPQAVSIPRGLLTGNYMTPISSPAETPTIFLPGVHRNVVKVRVPRSESQTWFLGTGSVSAKEGIDSYGATGAESRWCSPEMSSAGCGDNISAQVTVTMGGISRNVATGAYAQTVTVYNPTSVTISNVALALDNLTATATLTNSAGNTLCAMPAGSPYVLVTTSLPPGRTASVNLSLGNSDASQPITYTPRVLGAGTR